jgi:hypothetical protein
VAIETEFTITPPRILGAATVEVLESGTSEADLQVGELCAYSIKLKLAGYLSRTAEISKVGSSHVRNCRIALDRTRFSA